MTEEKKFNFEASVSIMSRILKVLSEKKAFSNQRSVLKEDLVSKLREESIGSKNSVSVIDYMVEAGFLKIVKIGDIRRYYYENSRNDIDEVLGRFKSLRRDFKRREKKKV